MFFNRSVSGPGGFARQKTWVAKNNEAHLLYVTIEEFLAVAPE